jgi:two-component system, cell cycle sensor histidine kinase and response regulator CckA
MEQVILNLAVNARDAMPRGGELTFDNAQCGIGRFHCERQQFEAGPVHRISRSRNGTGIELSIQTRLFEPLFTIKPTGKGTGLGLSTVYGILKQANGQITFTSQPGHGTTFRIFLPRVDSALPADTDGFETDAALHGRETV